MSAFQAEAQKKKDEAEVQVSRKLCTRQSHRSRKEGARGRASRRTACLLSGAPPRELEHNLRVT